VATPSILGPVESWSRIRPDSALTGVNQAYIANGHIVKIVEPFLAGITHPKYEAIHPRIFRALGVPHHIVHHFEHEGRHFIHAPLEHGWRNLDRLGLDDVKKFDPKVVAKILTAEYGLRISDRHGGNYVVKGGETQPTPIDAGVVGGHGDGDLAWSQLYHAMKSVDRSFHKHPIDQEVAEGLQKYAKLPTKHKIPYLAQRPGAVLGDLV